VSIHQEAQGGDSKQMEPSGLKSYKGGLIDDERKAIPAPKPAFEADPATQ